MANFTLTDAQDILEELYVKENQISDMIFRENALLAMLPKKANGGGKYRHIPVIYTRPQGRSANFTKARTAKTGSKVEGFNITMAKDYGIGGVDGDVVEDMAANTEMITDAIRMEMDGVLANLRDSLGHKIYRNTGGARGRVGSFATDTITLLNAEDVIHFEIGQIVVLSTADGTSGSVKSGTLTVDGVNRNSGIISFTANVATGIPTAANNDYIFVDGDFGASIAGLDAWIPSAEPTAGDSFFGVDRSVDSRLSGIRYDGRGLPIHEALLNGATRARRYKSRISHVFVNPLVWNDLALAQGDRKVIEQVMGKGEEAAHLGFDALMIVTPAGRIPVLEDSNCPTDLAWMIDADKFELEHTTDKLVRLIDEDGQMMLRETDNDGFEFRAKARCRLNCYDPSKHVRVRLA